MIADGAYIGRILANVDMPAVVALPRIEAIAFEDLARIDALDELAIALFMLLFNGAHAVEKLGQGIEALGSGRLGEFGVHVGPLVVLAIGSVGQVGERIGHAAIVKRLEPELGVLFLVLGRLEEDVLNLDVAVLLRLAGVILILGVSLRFAGKGGHEVLLGLRPLQFHVHSLLLRAPTCPYSNMQNNASEQGASTMSQSVTIAFLGPAGTYSDEAAHAFAKRLGVEAEFVALPSFNTVFEYVDQGKCDYGVVPTENSLEGSVTSTLDNFAFNSDCVILGEEVLSIHHCLLVSPETTMADIKTVYSHPQGLAQCRRYLNAHLPNCQTIATSSTAESARIAASTEGVAGIGNEFAAELHGATVLEREIEDHYGNQTCFALIGRRGTQPVFQGTKFKTSLALFLNANKAGTLHMILSEFAYAGIDLSMIQSRPTKQGLGDYMFFVNIDGSIYEPDVQTALSCLRLKLREVKVLGCYPVA